MWQLSQPPNWEARDRGWVLGQDQDVQTSTWATTDEVLAAACVLNVVLFIWARYGRQSHWWLPQGDGANVNAFCLHVELSPSRTLSRFFHPLTSVKLKVRLQCQIFCSGWLKVRLGLSCTVSLIGSDISGCTRQTCSYRQISLWDLVIAEHLEGERHTDAVTTLKSHRVTNSFV